jgi:hypothetical protein
MGSLDSYLGSQTGSGFKRAKWPRKIGKQLINFIFGSAGCFLSRLKTSPVAGTSYMEAFLQFLIKKRKKFSCIFILFLVITTLDP